MPTSTSTSATDATSSSPENAATGMTLSEEIEKGV